MLKLSTRSSARKGRCSGWRDCSGPPSMASPWLHSTRSAIIRRTPWCSSALSSAKPLAGTPTTPGRQGIKPSMTADVGPLYFRWIWRRSLCPRGMMSWFSIVVTMVLLSGVEVTSPYTMDAITITLHMPTSLVHTTAMVGINWKETKIASIRSLVDILTTSGWRSTKSLNYGTPNDR